MADKILNNDLVMWWISRDRWASLITQLRPLCWFV